MSKARMPMSMEDRVLYRNSLTQAELNGLHVSIGPVEFAQLVATLEALWEYRVRTQEMFDEYNKCSDTIASEVGL